MKPCKFKVGDKVIRIHGGFHQNPMTIKEIEYSNVHVCWYLGFEFNGNLNDTRCGWEEKYYELVEESKEHLHKDLIIDWARVAEIEWFDEGLELWLPTKSPAWSETIKYRIKPQVQQQQPIQQHQVIYIDCSVKPIPQPCIQMQQVQQK